MLKVPYTAMDLSVLEVLLKNGYLSRLERKGKGYKRILAIGLNDAEHGMRGLKFISRPSRRIYVGYQELRPVRQGFGISVLSTPKGILSGDEARKTKTGGEMLFQIW